MNNNFDQYWNSLPENERQSFKTFVLERIAARAMQENAEKDATLKAWEAEKILLLQCDGENLKINCAGLNSIALNKLGVKYLVSHLNQWLALGEVKPIPESPEFPAGFSCLGLTTAAYQE